MNDVSYILIRGRNSLHCSWHCTLWIWTGFQIMLVYIGYDIELDGYFSLSIFLSVHFFSLKLFVGNFLIQRYLIY